MSPDARESVRTCLGCRARRPRRELIRIVRGPEQAVCFDVEARLPGRGAWVCPTATCVDALNPGALAHVLRGPVKLAAAPERRLALGASLERRAANLATMARKVRGTAFGSAGVRAALAATRVPLLLVAADLPEDTAAAWAARAGAAAVRRVPDAGALGRLFGTRPVAVAAVTSAGIGAALLEAIDRWQTFFTHSCDNQKLGTERARRVARGDAAAGGG